MNFKALSVFMLIMLVVSQAYAASVESVRRIPKTRIKVTLPATFVPLGTQFEDSKTGVLVAHMSVPAGKDAKGKIVSVDTLPELVHDSQSRVLEKEYIKIHDKKSVLVLGKATKQDGAIYYQWFRSIDGGKNVEILVVTYRQPAHSEMAKRIALSAEYDTEAVPSDFEGLSYKFDYRAPYKIMDGSLPNGVLLSNGGLTNSYPSVSLIVFDQSDLPEATAANAKELFEKINNSKKNKILEGMQPVKIGDLRGFEFAGRQLDAGQELKFSFFYLSGKGTTVMFSGQALKVSATADISTIRKMAYTLKPNKN